MVQSADVVGVINQRSILINVCDFFILVVKILWTLISSAFLCLIPIAKKSLTNEVVLVTGAGRGLGKELALKFADEGAILVLWDIDEESVLNLETELRERGTSAHAYACDVSDLRHVQKVGERVQAEVGDVTIVVNNAGILQNVYFTDLDLEKIKRTLEVNLLAHFWINKFFLPRMIEMGKGHIVATSSVAGLRGWLYLADYSATKFAIFGMMEAMEEEIRILGMADKIHFTTAFPITMDTGMNHNPTTRLPSVMPILSVRKSADTIVDAVQKEERLVTIPRMILYPIFLLRLLPRKVAQLVFDFLEYNMIPNSVKHTGNTKCNKA